LDRIIAAPSVIAEVGGPADEGHGELPLVDVVRLVGRREHLGLVDVVHPDGLQDLGLGEVADPALGHDRDRDGGDDRVDHVRVAHPGHAALGADVGGDPFQRHDGHGARVLGDLGLLGRDDVHDHAALEHVGHAALDALGPPLRGRARGAVGAIGRMRDRHGIPHLIAAHD
jgi:hypothetical protein